MPRLRKGGGGPRAPVAARLPRAATDGDPAAPAPILAAPGRRRPTPHPPAAEPAGRDPGRRRGTGGHDSSLTDFLAPPQADDELGRLGKYRILKVLGHGGMGVVFQAEDPSLKRTVALKAMLPALAASAGAGQRFLREAQAMAAVEHDHVVRIYQVDEDRGVPFLAMEFLKGEPLDERLEREGRLPLPEVLRIGREVAEGLAAAHATGLIHRDVKPANVWLEAPQGPGQDPRLRAGPRGLARTPRLTQQGAIIGTPAYMAPEQARGEAVDARCDLFSLGGVLYRMSPGSSRSGARTPSPRSWRSPCTSRRPGQVDPALPQELSDLVMRLLEKDAGKRPASAAEVVEALQAMERNWPRRKRPTGPPP